VGQAIQPIVSSSFGVKNIDRARSVLRYALVTAMIMGMIFFSFVMCFPDIIMRIYMDATEEILNLGPGIARVFSFAYLLMGINIVTSYYLQALKQSTNALIVSLLRGFVICLILMTLLPAIVGFNAIWLTMPLTELLTLFVALKLLQKK
jgi:Na+-driven multidrug efflux pump